MSQKSKIKSDRRQQRKKRQQQRRPAAASRVSADLHIQKIKDLLSAVEDDADQQRDSGSPHYEIPWRLLGRLVATALPVTADAGDFMLKLKQLSELLPESFAKRGLDITIENMLSLDPADRAISAMHTLYRESRWQSQRCQVISLDAELAAAMMLTNYPRELLSDFRPPWDAFMIRLPAGLIEWDGVKYTDVMIHRYDSPALPPLEGDVPSDVREMATKMERFMAERPRERWGLYGMSGERGYLQGEAQLVEQLRLVRPQYFVKPVIPDGDPSEGVLVLFARLVAGVCCLANPDSTRRTSPDDSPITEWQLLSRVLHSDVEQDTVKKYLNRLKTIGYAMPPTQLDLGQLNARYAFGHEDVDAGQRQDS